MVPLQSDTSTCDRYFSSSAISDIRRSLPTMRRVPLSRVVESIVEFSALRNFVFEPPAQVPARPPARGPVCLRGRGRVHYLSIAHSAYEKSLRSYCRIPLRPDTNSNPQSKCGSLGRGSEWFVAYGEISSEVDPRA